MMFRSRHVLALALFVSVILLVAGCADSRTSMPAAPTNALLATPTGIQSGSAEARSTGCYAVKFHVKSEDGGHFYFTGDLSGTIEMTWDFDSFKYAGVTEKNGGTYTWTITGGIIPELRTFQTAFTNKNLVTDRPGSPDYIFENIGTHRAISGVSKANLAYHGSFIYQPPVVLLDHLYSGVICP